MESFLKRFSTVPNGFIEDFFDIAKEGYNDEDLNIDFNVVVKWLSVQKAHLKRVLIHHFIESKDFKITKRKQINKIGPGTNYIEDILITPDCFKGLCMLSQTERAKQVRQYYLAIEKLIKKYHHYIQEQLYSKINVLENNQKPKVNIEEGIIYFFKALNQLNVDDEKDDIYKIGKTKNKKNRFAVYSPPFQGNNMRVILRQITNV